MRNRDRGDAPVLFVWKYAKTAYSVLLETVVNLVYLLNIIDPARKERSVYPATGLRKP